MLRTVKATNYLTPLREGGSLPGIVEADDDGTYVMKFRGAGQGQKALIAEVVAGEIGRALGLPVPEIVLMEFDPAIARNEPDEEIQTLLKASAGLNLGIDYLPGSFGYDPLLKPPVESDLASAVVWFDAYVTNVDRTPRNTNMLLWHKKLWLIDHGASLYFQHTWSDYLERSRTPFKPIKDHVLLPLASNINEADARLRPVVTDALLTDILAAVPDEWLDEPLFASPNEQRAAFVSFLQSRRDAADIFVQEAADAHAQLV